MTKRKQPSAMMNEGFEKTEQMHKKKKTERKQC